jgi:hypothetical protein
LVAEGHGVGGTVTSLKPSRRRVKGAGSASERPAARLIWALTTLYRICRAEALEAAN